MNPAPSSSASSPTPSRESLAVISCYASSCGRVTLYLGDSVELRHMIPADAAIISDPPYGIKVNTRNATRANTPPHSRTVVAAKDWQPVEGDEKDFDPAPWLEWKRIVLWGANNYASRLPDSPSWLAWNKRTPEGFKKSQVELQGTYTKERNQYGEERYWVTEPDGTHYLKRADQVSPQNDQIHP